MRIASALLGLATLAAPASAQPPAPDWQPLFKPRPGGPMNLYWNRAGIVRRADVVEVVVRAEANVGGGPKHGDFLTEIRCSDRRWRVVRTTNYGPGGEPIVENHARARFARIKAGTYHETIRSAVC